MLTLIDTSLWVDFFRARSPRPLKQFIAPHIFDPAAHLAEPIRFEVLRYATPTEAKLIARQFQTFPLLPTPADVWTSATRIGQECRSRGITVASLDLLIAAVALAAGAKLITFDTDFQHVARACALQVELLRLPN